MNRSRWLVLAALGLLLIVLSNSHVTLFHGGFRLFGFNPLVTAILLAVVIWVLLDRCGTANTTPASDEAAEPRHTAPMADVNPEAEAGSEASSEHENGEDADKTD